MTILPTTNLFGSSLTYTFSEVFPTANDFAANLTEYASLGTMQSSSLTDDQKSQIWLLLTSEFANSPIAFLSVDQFKLRIATYTYTYGDTLFKQLSLRSTMRNLADPTKSKTSIHNHAFNPDTTPATDTTSPLSYINEQNAYHSIKDPLDSYAQQYTYLDQDPIASFLSHFRSLFNNLIPYPLPLYYVFYND